MLVHSYLQSKSCLSDTSIRYIVGFTVVLNYLMNGSRTCVRSSKDTMKLPCCWVPKRGLVWLGTKFSNWDVDCRTSMEREHVPWGVQFLGLICILIWIKIFDKVGAGHYPAWDHSALPCQVNAGLLATWTCQHDCCLRWAMPSSLTSAGLRTHTDQSG